jgi:hypothetical protein
VAVEALPVWLAEDEWTPANAASLVFTWLAARASRIGSVGPEVVVPAAEFAPPNNMDSAFALSATVSPEAESESPNKADEASASAFEMDS